VLHGGPDPLWEEAILRGRACPDMPDDTLRQLRKMAEPIEMPFGLWTGVGRRKHVLHGGTLASSGECEYD